MAELSPLPLPTLIARAFGELEHDDSIFGLPSRKFVLGGRHDTSVLMHGRRVSAPLGPSAGPHTQMAQNIVLGWLAGARVFELKTVQVLDRLKIPRPCIETGNATYNVEWSQELTLRESLEEYVKASMLIDMLAASGSVPIRAGFDHRLFDISVGYDREGIRSDAITSFLEGMRDARQMVDVLRRRIPQRYAYLRDVDFTTAISGSVTLSTFHGCPVSEIEQIADYLMSGCGFDCTIKLNPTLLGPATVNEILGDRLGYEDVVVPRGAFEKDPSWSQASAIVGRLRDRARALGRGFGVKLTNTLVVENRSTFLPKSEPLVYLSGAPLHVLAMHLVHRFREEFSDTVPISFSAGIDRLNYPDAVSLGLVPVTVCTDLLRQGGYGRLQAYATELARRMDDAGAVSIEEFILAADDAPVRTPAEALLFNVRRYVEVLDRSERYRNPAAKKSVRKTGAPLGLFDCATCDLCLSVCPNAATMSLPSLSEAISHEQLVRRDGAWERVEVGTVRLGEKRQIACIADLCNDCGNCEMFCPDDGAPNRLKMRFFTSERAWRREPATDGFHVTNARVLGRVDGNEYELELVGDHSSVYSGASFRIELRERTTTGDGPDQIDLWPYALMDFARRSALDSSHVNFINCGLPEEA